MEMAVADVEVISNTVRKPVSPHPPPYLNTTVPLTLLDIVSPNTPIPMLLAFPPPMPSNPTLITSLLTALSHFPHLAGTFSFDPSNRHPPPILLNDAGVRVVETQVPTTLQFNLPLDPSTKIYFNLTPLMSGGSELLQVQLNRFACGGMVIGITIHHWVADATSYSAFIVAWSRVLRGLDVHPLPYHDRAAAVTQRVPPRSDFDDESQRKKKPFSHCTPNEEGPKPPATNLSVHYSNNFLGKLKSKVNDGSPKDRQCSTFQCLLAHVWKKLTFVRELERDATTNFQFSVNGRRRMRPPVPDEYFGNYILGATATMKVGEVLEGSYTDVGRAIREAVERIDEEYFLSFLGYGASVEWEEVKSEMVGPSHSLGANVFNTSWLRLGFDGVDFGSGGLCAFLVPGIPIEGFTLFVPSFEDGGGVNFLVALKDKESAELFNQVSHSLD